MEEEDLVFLVLVEFLSAGVATRFELLPPSPSSPSGRERLAAAPVDFFGAKNDVIMTAKLVVLVLRE